MKTWKNKGAFTQNLPVQVVGSLVQEGVILSDKLSPDQLGTWLLHHHFFGQLEISGEELRSVIRQPTTDSIELYIFHSTESRGHFLFSFDSRQRFQTSSENRTGSI